jgi:hypothetical protein
MFESITEAILRHKQVVIAAIAITALAGYVVPLNQFAAATLGPIIIGDDGATDGATDGDTNVEDVLVQEGTATATGEQNPSIDADNTQTNAIVTGDATASQTNTATSRANAFSIAAGGDAIGGDGGDDKCGDCDKKKDPKKKYDGDYSKSRDGSNGGGGDGGFAIGGDADSDADATSTATVSGNTNVADTSADNNDQSNTNTQSFDLDLDQEVEAEVEQDAIQVNDNYFNVEFDDLDLPF